MLQIGLVAEVRDQVLVAVNFGYLHLNAAIGPRLARKLNIAVTDRQVAIDIDPDRRAADWRVINRQRLRKSAATSNWSF